MMKFLKKTKKEGMHTFRCFSYLFREGFSIEE